LPAFSLSVFLTLFCPLSFVKSSSSVMRTTLQSGNSRSAITPMFEEGEQQISRIIRENFVVVEAGMVDPPVAVTVGLPGDHHEHILILHVRVQL